LVFAIVPLPFSLSTSRGYVQVSRRSPTAYTADGTGNVPPPPSPPPRRDPSHC
jgi:hypothetical protein